MRTSIREIRAHLTSLDVLVAKEREILLTKRGKPIARILPLSGPRGLPSRASLRAKMARLKRPSEHHVRAERDAR